MNNPEKRTKAKNAAKQGNAGERPDAAARYTVKSSGVNSLLFINSAGGRCHDNARCESIRGLVTRMKNELFFSTDYTIEQLKTMIWRYYMSYWNNRRICCPLAECLRLRSAADITRIRQANLRLTQWNKYPRSAAKWIFIPLYCC